jgi:SAM-dependent methyltransferase
VALAVGVDPDQSSLVEHRARRVGLVSGFAEGLPFADGSFDLVLCSWVLEHLAYPVRAFSEIARVLRDPIRGRSGGHFCFLTPNARHPLIWVNRLLSRFGDWQPRLVARLYRRAEADTFSTLYRANTARRIEQLALAEGLAPVAFRHIGDPSYLAFNERLYRMATYAERVTPRWMRVHIVGDFVKASRHDTSR